MVSKRQLNKQTLVNTFGGKCQICGYNKCLGALAFHHLDPKLKAYNISAFAGNIKLSYEDKQELCKCILLCSNCHFELHSGMHQDKLKEITPLDIEMFLD